MNHKERASSLRPRPYGIVYIKGPRRLRDSAETLDGAVSRARSRLAKRHNRNELAEVYFGGELVWQGTAANGGIDAAVRRSTPA